MCFPSFAYWYNSQKTFKKIIKNPEKPIDKQENTWYNDLPLKTGFFKCGHFQVYRADGFGRKSLYGTKEMIRRPISES